LSLYEKLFSKGAIMKKLIIFVLLSISSSVFAEDVYVLRTKIGDKVFNDIFTYGGCVYPQIVNGTITVPGVFTSAVEEGKCSFNWNGEHINFKIKVKENNEEYYVVYTLSIRGQSISGRIIKETQEMATIEGELIYEGK
jgi:hypothetical protein